MKSSGNNFGALLKDLKPKQLIRINLGLIKYKQAWEIQKKLVKVRSKSQIPDCLIVCEHEPVITMGRGTDKKNLLVSKKILKERGVELYEIERGGDITFHGPGQTVLYPIIDLRQRNNDTHKYLRDLESTAISALGVAGLTAGIKEGMTGIWVNDFKIGAIGVAVSKWITYHGMALNVNVDLDYFKLINPCGITEYQVSTVCTLLKKQMAIDDMNDLLVEAFIRHFGYNNIKVKNIDQMINKKGG